MIGFHERIENNFEVLKPAEKKAAIYMKKNWETVSIMTAKELGENAGVSEATVHRLAQQLGYDKFAKMKSHIKELLVSKRALVNIDFKENTEGENLVNRHYKEEINNLTETYKLNSEEKFNDASDIILNSKRVWVIGEKLGLSVSSYLNFTINYLLGNCNCLNFSNYSENIAYMNEDDVLIVVGFQRYCSKTLKIAEICKSKGVKVITFTDCNLSPFVEYSDIQFYVSVNSITFLDSYTAVVSLANGLINSLISKNIKEVRKNVEEIEKIYGSLETVYKW